MDPLAADRSDAVIGAFLAELGGDHRRVAPGEWGVSLDCAGWPLHVGIACRGGLVRAQAEAVAPGRVDAALLLVRNRRVPLVRYSHTAAGAVWVQGELPLTSLDGGELDRLLGLLVDAAAWARYAAADEPPPPST